MNRTALKGLYAVAVSIQCLCMAVICFYAFARNGRGPWGFYLLGSLAVSLFSRKAHATLKTQISD